jgi:uncharacterized damage-inducible protein DinB
MKKMLRSFALSLFCAAMALVCLPLAHAQEQGTKMKPIIPLTQAAPASGVRAEFLTELKVREDKFVRLAEAIPADKYTWRPAEGVRSVSEVFLHVAAANYNLPRNFGFPVPAGFTPRGFDKSTTDKTKIIDTLKDSFAHVRQAVLNVPDSDLEKQVDWFTGSKITYRGIMLFIIAHMSEHLGQSIAYARVNGIVPPWTEDQQKK